jgi:protein TonB
MTDHAHPGPLAPDNPARRLPWILAISVLLVLLALLGLGRSLRAPAPVAHKRKPLEARIYELPASPAAQAARPAPRVQRHANTSTPHVSSPKGAVLAPSHRPTQSHRHPAIDWKHLRSQVDAAVRQSVPSLPEHHDPNTLVARYYMASLLLKMQRIGDLNYPTNLTGTPVLKLVIGSDGKLLKLKLLRSSGSDTLDRDALQIVRDSAPFAPFPDDLNRQTSHIEVVCYMNFEGYRQISAEY